MALIPTGQTAVNAGSGVAGYIVGDQVAQRKIDALSFLMVKGVDLGPVVAAGLTGAIAGALTGGRGMLRGLGLGMVGYAAGSVAQSMLPKNLQLPIGKASKAPVHIAPALIGGVGSVAVAKLVFRS